MGVAAAIAGSAVLGAGASIYAGSKAASAQKKAAKVAANAQLQASEDSNELEKYMYDTSRADLAPWRDAGKTALGTLQTMYMGGESDYEPIDTSKFDTSPGYQFRVNEAMKAIQRSAASTGKLRSGATLSAIDRQVQGIASDEYNNWYGQQYAERGYKASRKDQAGNRLAAMAGVGQTATNDTANLGSQYASSVSANNNSAARATGDAAIAAGNAKASSYVNTANSINSGVQNLASLYLYNQGFGGSGSTLPSYAGYRA